MADYNSVMQQIQAQAAAAANARMQQMVASGRYVPTGDGGLWDVSREQAISRDQIYGDAMVPAMQQYVQANPGDPAAQQMAADLKRAQDDAHKGDFGSMLHGFATSAVLGGGLSGFGMPGMGLGESLAAQGGLFPGAGGAGAAGGGEMLGEGVFGPPAPGGSFFVGPTTPAAPTPILGEGLMGPPAPGGEFFTGPPTPAATGTTPAQLPDVQNLPGTNSPILPTIPGTTTTIIPGTTASGLLANIANAGTVGTIARTLNEIFGTNLTDDDISLLGKLGGAGLGLLAADNQTNALQGILDQQRAERKPALDAFNNMLNNPDQWYNSAPAQGSVDSVLRRLSVNGNPAGNPADLAKAAAYNLGGYTQQLGVLGGLGLSGQNTTAQLGTQVAQSQQTPYNIGANLLGQLTTPQQNPFEQWMAAVNKYGKLDGGGPA